MSREISLCHFTFLLPCVLFISLVNATVPADGICSLYLFAPFTSTGAASPLNFPVNFTLEEAREWAANGYDDLNGTLLPVGFSNMAAAVLAVNDFNSRNTDIIPELGTLDDCNVQLDISRVFNTGFNNIQSSRALLKSIVVDDETSVTNDGSGEVAFCGIVGPSHDVPARALSTFAEAAQVPLVVAYRQRITRDSLPGKGSFFPMDLSVYPDLFETSVIVVSYLLHLGRSNFVAFLHPFSELGLMKRGAIGVSLDREKVTWMSSDYLDNADGVNPGEFDTENDEAAELLETRTVRYALKRILDSGYRTIIIAVDDPLTLLAIADAAVEFGMTNGDYFFILYDPLTPNSLLSGDNIAALLQGACFVLSISTDFLDPGLDPLTRSWKQHGSDFVSQVNALNPLIPSDPGYFEADDDLFSSASPSFGSAFIYDAVLSMGFGACQAAKQSDGTITSVDHVLGIRNSTFVGASGLVKFGRTTLERGGVRPVFSTSWVVSNFISYEPFLVQSAALYSFNSSSQEKQIIEFIDLDPYVYAGNMTTAPFPLRTPGDLNYIPKWMRAFGLSLMSFALLGCAGIAFLVYRYRSHHVLKASQPFFLYLVIGGSAIQTLAVLPLSFDEGAGWSTSQLTILCNTLPWFFASGYVIVLGALYVKLWRVHKTLQFSRRRLRLSHIALPVIILAAATFIILVVQVTIAPLEWIREEEDLTGDSTGGCASSTGKVAFWVVPLACVVIILMFLLGFAAYKTRDVDGAYSESSWIVVMMVTHIEIMLIAVPLVISFQSVEPGSSYLIFVFLDLIFPGSTLGVIFVPKMYALWLSLTGQDKQRKRGQRSSQQVRVTGLGPPPKVTTTSRLSADPSAAPPNNNNTVPEEAPHESLAEPDEALSAASLVESAAEEATEALPPNASEEAPNLCLSESDVAHSVAIVEEAPTSEEPAAQSSVPRNSVIAEDPISTP